VQVDYKMRADALITGNRGNKKIRE
jgi:hypothetical protein